MLAWIDHPCLIDREAKWYSHEAKQFGSSSETYIDLMLFCNSSLNVCCTCTWMEVVGSALPQRFSSLYFQIGSPAEPGVWHVSWPAGQQASGPTRLYPDAKVTAMRPGSPFMFMSEFLTLAHQALSTLSHIPSLYSLSKN